MTQWRRTGSAAPWACFSFKCQTDRSDPIALVGTRNISIARDLVRTPKSAAGFAAHEAKHFVQGINACTYRRIHEFEAYVWQRAANKSFQLSDEEIWGLIRANRNYRHVPE